MPEKKDSALPAIPSGKKYLAAWITAQLVGNLPWLAPWITNQIKAAQKVDATLVAPDSVTVLYAGIILLLSTVAVFVHKVWKELEADAVRGTANLVKAAPGMAWDLIGRCWDAFWSFSTGWMTWWSFTRRYLAELRYRYGLFNDKGLGLINASRLDLDKVYVELKASANVNLNKPNLNPVSREIRDRAPIWEHLRTLRPGFSLAVIGAPGSGKTTLFHHVLLTYARGRQWRRRTRFRLPVFVELRKIAAELPDDPKKAPDLPKLIESLWKKDSRFAEITKHMPKGWLAARLRSGRCLLLWDGLDEVADPAERCKVRDWLEKAAIDHPDYRANLSLVSARPAGYRTAPLEHAQVLEVQSFEWEDTKCFTRQWYHATEVVSSGNIDNAEVRRRAEEDSQSLLTRLQDSPKLGDLAVNPLLLTMICMVHRYHGALPGSRSQLYDEICQVLLERWRQQRGMEDKFTSQQKLEVLRPLALWMMQHQVKDIQEADMLAIIAEPLARIGVPPGEAAALSFIHDLRDSSGLWLERELKVWAFAHLSFQEHLCADAWARDEKARPVDWTPLVGTSWWRETLLLYAGKAADASPLAEAALKGDSHCHAFALQLLDEKINIHATTRQRMEEVLVHSLGSQDEAIFRPAAEAFLVRQQERNYHRLDDEKQISGWVSQAEYQVFLLWQKGVDRDVFTPLHLRTPWFVGQPKDPLLGLTGLQANIYCLWLDYQFPSWSHRLPVDDHEVTQVASPAEHLLSWLGTGKGAYTLQSTTRAWRSWNQKNFDPHGLDINLDINVDIDLTFALALALALALDLDLAHAHARARARDIARARALARARDLDLARDLDRDRDLDLARDLDRALARALARSLDLGLALERDLDLDRDLVDRALDRDRARALDRDRDFSRGLTRYLAQKLILILEGDRDRTQARDRTLVRTLASDRNFNFDHLEMDKRLTAMAPYLTRSGQHMIACLRPLLPATSLYPTSVTFRSAFQQFLVACFDAIREHDPKLITPDMAALEAAIRLIIARSKGKAPAWEGLRVVRERRK